MSYLALFIRFLRFGALAFGGPVAQIAMIRRELVDEERWIASDRFNRLLAVMQILPGPEAHELCVHLGIRAKGRWGGLLAGLGFMLPGLVLMLALAWAYTRLTLSGSLLGAAFLGVQAAVIAVIVRAVHRIGEHILQDRTLWLIAIGSFLASMVGMTFWIVLAAAGAIHALAAAGRYAAVALMLASAVLIGTLILPVDSGGTLAGIGGPQVVPSAQALFWTGLKGGLLTFGGAYTAIPFIRADTVGRGWMSDGQFLDGLGLSAILPAPLVIFATFAGWISGGLIGALAITAGMFLPAFAFSMVFYKQLEALAEHRRLQLVLTGVAAGVVGVIVLTITDLVQTTVARTPNLTIGVAIFAAALIVLYRWKSKLAPPLVLAMGAMVGLSAYA